MCLPQYNCLYLSSSPSCMHPVHYVACMAYTENVSLLSGGKSYGMKCLLLFVLSESPSIALKRACQVLIKTDLTSSKINCLLASVISARKAAVNEMKHE